ncbi:MAG: S9 family peptidase [Bacteroidales bacterium]|nr:S9 family peptidase [Bacteroidales bacterium]
MKPPIANKIPRELTLHGHTRTDNYYWLNQRGTPEVESYLDAENQYTVFALSDVAGLKEKLYQEITGRIKQTDMSVPYKENGYFYYTRYEEGSEYPVFCRKKHTLEAPEEIVLNVNEMARGHKFFNVSGYTVSPDNKMAAYGVDTRGNRIYTIFFKNLETGEILPGTIKNTSGGATWAADSKTVFFTLKEKKTLRSYQVHRYIVGSSAKPELVYHETDAAFHCYVYKSRSKKYIIIGSSATTTDEYRILEAGKPFGSFKVFHERRRGLEYSIGHFNEKFYVRTNHNAVNFCLMETPETETSIENWKTIVPHRSDVLLENFVPFNNFLVIEERIKGINNLRVISHKSGNEHYIDFGEDAYVAWVSVNPEFDTNIIRIGFSSLTIPVSTYDYDMENRSFNLLKQQEVVGGYCAGNYKSERVYVTARDGASVPVSLVYSRKTIIGSNTPFLLYGYGSYGHSMEPYFSSVRLSLLDRGFVFAIAHVRGGEDLGRTWYDNGKLLNKKNTFYDFIDCAKYFIVHNYTSPDKLFAMGGSAGGLLLGAVINMEPELFKGIVAAVPFVDVVTTMLDDSLPLTTGEYDEWGNPRDETYYHYMLSYSPYDNIHACNYPNMLVTTGYHDSQVQYWEPAKWVAKLREMNTGNNLILLHTNMEAGHSGASGRFKQHLETALEYAFILKIAGITG